MEFKMSELKRAVLFAAVQKYGLALERMRGRLKTALSAKGEQPAYYDRTNPPRIEILEEVSLLSNHIQMAANEFDVLRKMENFVDHLHTFIELGALVMTNRGLYFVSVDLDQLKVQGKTITAIPVQSSFYQAMKGKREGENFKHEGLHYEVREIL